MELWIRSQDKKDLIKVNNIKIQDHYSYKEVRYNFMKAPNHEISYEERKEKDKYIGSELYCNDKIYLGVYKTEKRALEVLGEIQDLINDIADYKMVGCVYEIPKE